jgi:GntR family transcriptional regulator
MFVGDDARTIILAKRKERFYNDYVVPLKSEALKLGITLEKLSELIQKGEST